MDQSLADQWRRNYRDSPYLSHLTEPQLQERAAEVLNNMLILTEEGKISPPEIGTGIHNWWEIWTHILEEFKRRYGPYPAGFDSGFIKKFRFLDTGSSRIPDISKIAQAAQGKWSRCLFKYSKKEYLRPMLERGLIRIAPAASYDDPSLNPAVRDDELQRRYNPPPSQFTIEILDQETLVPIRKLVPTAFEYTHTATTNSYIYCLSRLFSPRLFLDFDADACLVINDPDRFGSLVCQAIEAQLPDWIPAGFPVEYIDPVRPGGKEPSLFLTKHFRYAYQAEYRISALPKTPKKELAPFFIEVGPLDGMAELISLED